MCTNLKEGLLVVLYHHLTQPRGTYHQKGLAKTSLRYSGAVLPLKLCSERLLEAARIIKEAAEEQEQSTEAFSRLQVTLNRLQKSRRTSRDQTSNHREEHLTSNPVPRYLGQDQTRPVQQAR